MAYVAICSTNWWQNEADQGRYAAQFPGLDAWAQSSRAVTLTEPEIVEILGNDWQVNGYDSGRLLMPDTWVSTAVNYIEIKAVGLARHLGKWDESRYVFLGDGGQYAFSWGASVSIFLHINGIQFDIKGVSGYYQDGLRFGYANGVSRTCILGSNIIRNTNPLSSGNAVEIGGDQNNFVYNNIVYGFTDGKGLVREYSELNLYNNTVIGCKVGISGSSTGAYKNNLVVDCETPYANVGSSVAEYNAFDSGVDPGANGIDLAGKTLADIFNDPANEDYSLNESILEIRQKGANLSDDSSYPFTTDIAGQTRPALPDPWDIGAWHYSGEAVGDPVPIKLVNIVNSSRVAIELASDGTPVTAPFQIAGTSQDVTFEYFEDTLIKVKVRRSSPSLGTRYKPYKANAIVTNKGVTVYVDQQIDEVAG